MADIYGLIDGRGALRYIGKANDCHERLKQHFRETRRRRTPLYDWMRAGKFAEILILEGDCEDWERSEREWIDAARRHGVQLLNISDGGDQQFCSMETRVENGRRNGKALMSDPRRKAIRDAKAMCVRTLRSFEREGRTDLTEQLRTKMRQRAADRPDIFGDWVHV